MLMLQRLLYQLVLLVFTPLAWRMAKQIDRRAGENRWRERFGQYPDAPMREPCIWFHAASVGEAKLAGLLLNSLREAGYSGAFVVTTTTETGAASIVPLLDEQDRHYYSPYDFNGTVQRAIRQIRPAVLVVFEKEIWPNLWRRVDEAGVPILVSNANLSERSLNRYRKICFRLLQDAVGRVRRIMAQNQAAAERFITLGTPTDRVEVTGNLKYALCQAAVSPDLAQTLRQQLGAGRPVWLAASTHAGEEAAILDVHQQLLVQHPELLLVIAPRHPQRFQQVAELCQESPLRMQQRTREPGPVSAASQVYLADTLGELNTFYAAVDLAVVCGSFVEVGGHNILEPAANHCPIIVGPDMRNAADLLADFLDRNALIQVADTAALPAVISNLFTHPEQGQALAKQAAKLLQAPTNQSQHYQAQQILAALSASDEEKGRH